MTQSPHKNITNHIFTLARNVQYVNFVNYKTISLPKVVDWFGETDKHFQARDGV